MKKYYTQIHSSQIIHMIRMTCIVLEDEINELINIFGSERELSEHKSCYKKYKDTKAKIKNYKEILEHEKSIDFIIIND